jgi:hypothetical protein
VSDDAADEGFGRRWSRLKRRAVETVVETPPEEVSTAEEMVEIPPPAETIPLGDITRWLGKKLPDGWREVALRRVWSADIDIRDFKGLADYAWDYTDPAGAPSGWGPLRASDDIASLLSRAIGEPMPPPELPPECLAEAPLFVAPQTADEIAPSAPEIPQPTAPEEPPARVARRGGRAAPV